MCKSQITRRLKQLLCKLLGLYFLHHGHRLVWAAHCTAARPIHKSYHKCLWSIPTYVTACHGQRFTQMMYDFLGACDWNIACWWFHQLPLAQSATLTRPKIKIFGLSQVRQLTPISLHVQQERMCNRSGRTWVSAAAQWLELLLQQPPRSGIFWDNDDKITIQGFRSYSISTEATGWLKLIDP